MFPSHEHRFLDSSSTQGVRELLGLPLKPQAVGVSQLLPLQGSSTWHAANRSYPENSFTFKIEGSQDSSQLKEVIGLCSGTFPPTLPPDMPSPTRNGGFSLSKRGTSESRDSHTCDSSSDDEPLGDEFSSKGNNSALLQWAEKKPRKAETVRKETHLEQGFGYNGDSENEDSDMPLIKRRRVKLKSKRSRGWV